MVKYIVYKTTNIINGKYYIGIHKTQDINVFDGYYGSGILLKLAIEKYGIEKFIRETLFVFETLEDARDKEREIVNYEFCQLEENYNISIGGTGGDTLAGATEDRRKEVSNKSINTKIKNGTLKPSAKDLPGYIERMKKIRVQPDNKGRVHSEKSKKNIRMANHMKGSKWITDGFNSKVLYPNEKIPEGWNYGRGNDYKKYESHSEESKRKIANSIRGDVCYNNGEVNLKLKIGQTPPDGFVKGMIQKHRVGKWITNGTSSKKLYENEKMPEGWYYGRIIKRKTNEQN